MKQLYPVCLEQERRYILLTFSDPCATNSNFLAELTQQKTSSFSFVMTRRKEKKGLVSSLKEKSFFSSRHRRCRLLTWGEEAEGVGLPPLVKKPKVQVSRRRG